MTITPEEQSKFIQFLKENCYIIENNAQGCYLIGCIMHGNLLVDDAEVVADAMNDEVVEPQMITIDSD